MHVGEKQKASLFAVSGACFLAVAKFLVGLFSGSMAVISSGLDSMMDVFMSAMNFFAISKAEEPADESHRYGHGKAEDIASAIQSIIIIGTGILIIYKSVDKCLESRQITYSVLDLSVMVISLIFSFVISRFLGKAGEKTGSIALKADALHYTSDLFSNSGAILAMILTFFTGMIFFDLLFAVIIGIILIVSAIKILRSGIAGLMDRSIPESVETEIDAIISMMPFPYVGYHKLRSRFAGSKKYIDFHLILCRRLDLNESHEMASTMESDIKQRIPMIDVIIHVEPCRYECDLTEENCVVLKKKRPRS